MPDITRRELILGTILAPFASLVAERRRQALIAQVVHNFYARLHADLALWDDEADFLGRIRNVTG